MESFAITDSSEDRYSRHHLIDWWDQTKLKNARVLVAGAGALGNEVLKNLALLGVGHITLIDFDIAVATKVKTRHPSERTLLSGAGQSREPSVCESDF